jgi:hypothetical protein
VKEREAPQSIKYKYPHFFTQPSFKLQIFFNSVLIQSLRDKMGKFSTAFVLFGLALVVSGAIVPSESGNQVEVQSSRWRNWLRPPFRPPHFRPPHIMPPHLRPPHNQTGSDSSESHGKPRPPCTPLPPPSNSTVPSPPTEAPTSDAPEQETEAPSSDAPEQETEAPSSDAPEQETEAPSSDAPEQETEAPSSDNQ